MKQISVPAKVDETIKKRNNKYQHALNDIINNAGTKFNCKHDSFWLMQELVDIYSFSTASEKVEVTE